MFGDRNEMLLYIDDWRGRPDNKLVKVTVPPSFFLPPDSWPEEGEKIRLEVEFYVYGGRLLMEFNKTTRFIPDDEDE
jgi:hypothetical protein